MLDFRLVAVLLTLIWLRVVAPSSPLAVALVLAVGLTSFVALLRWARIGRLVARHPGVLAADLVLGLVVLTVVGVKSPFAYALLGTALLAGALCGYAGAGVFGLLLVACHEAAALGDGEPAGFATVVTMPALYPPAAFAAAAIGRLIIERSVAVQRAASVETRTAVARDLHDTLAKTVQGLHFTAAALESAAASGDTGAVRPHAGALRGAASRAEREARSLMKNWRIDRDGHPSSLADVLTDAVRECVAGGGLLVDVPGGDSGAAAADLLHRDQPRRPADRDAVGRRRQGRRRQDLGSALRRGGRRVRRRESGSARGRLRVGIVTATRRRPPAYATVAVAAAAAARRRVPAGRVLACSDADDRLRPRLAG